MRTWIYLHSMPNLVQGYFDAFCSKDSAKVSSFISDTVVRIAPGYGDTSTSKSYWMKICKGWWPLFFDLTTKDVVMLPAIKPTTLKPDGNVSVYATWVDNAVNGIKIIHKYHGLFKFNKDHKIIFADEYRMPAECSRKRRLLRNSWSPIHIT